MNIDLLVDALLCLAYLVEMKDEFDVHLSPGWLYKWRSYDLWYILYFDSPSYDDLRFAFNRLYCQWLTFWNLGSFIMRKDHELPDLAGDAKKGRGLEL